MKFLHPIFSCIYAVWEVVNMKALITGASSGLGRDMARVLSEMGYDIIAVARREERLLELKKELSTNVEIICCDVTVKEDCIKLAERADEIDVFINNAGFGVFGELCETDLDAELKMIETNVTAVHILTKLVAKKFKEKNSGHILNVASLAAFFPGPLFGAYYSSKSYVLRLSQALSKELEKEKSNVKISVLCPGPVHTEFEKVAGVNFGKGTEKVGKSVILASRNVAEYAIKKMLLGKTVIIPGALMKIGVFFRRIFSENAMSEILYKIQKNKLVIK